MSFMTGDGGHRLVYCCFCMPFSMCKAIFNKYILFFHKENDIYIYEKEFMGAQIILPRYAHWLRV